MLDFLEKTEITGCIREGNPTTSRGSSCDTTVSVFPLLKILCLFSLKPDLITVLHSPYFQIGVPFLWLDVSYKKLVLQMACLFASGPEEWARWSFLCVWTQDFLLVKVISICRAKSQLWWILEDSEVEKAGLIRGLQLSACSNWRIQVQHRFNGCGTSSSNWFCCYAGLMSTSLMLCVISVVLYKMGRCLHLKPFLQVFFFFPWIWSSISEWFPCSQRQA